MFENRKLAAGDLQMPWVEEARGRVERVTLREGDMADFEVEEYKGVVDESVVHVGDSRNAQDTMNL